jgi:hypothetical protein
MMSKTQEIGEELKSVLSGRTIDALLPPLVFVLANAFFSLEVAVLAALGLALSLAVLRIFRKQSWYYALGGLLGVGLAAGLALLTQNASSYFLPAIIGSALLSLAALVSIFIGKPLAAWLSHLTRGWPLNWFWRWDVKPAYTEVTWVWALLIAVRLGIQILLYQQGDATTLGWANFVLGWPVTIAVLVLSYLYGIWRLRKLGGPGVHEFREGKDPPWEGQTRGF